MDYGLVITNVIMMVAAGLAIFFDERRRARKRREREFERMYEGNRAYPVGSGADGAERIRYRNDNH